MTAFEKYLEYEDKIDALEDEGASEEEIDKLEDEQLAIRNNEFTKEDWERLIEKYSFSGRAKYEYTRMMNEKFPPKSEDDIPDDVMALYGAKEG